MFDRTFVFAGLVALATAVGCKPDAGKSGDPAAAPDGAAEKQQLVAKINVYVACLNNMNPEVRTSRKRYLEWAGVDGAGLTADKASGGVPSVGRETTYGYECFKRDGGLDAIDGKPPKNDALDKAGAAYKKSLLATMDVINKASDYYEHKNYKDDALAKGKEMHKPLVAAYESFEKSTDDLEAALQTIQDKMNVEDLAELEKSEGKKAHWHQQDVMRNGELFIRAMSKQDKLDVAALQPAIDAYTKSFEDLKDWTDKNKPEADKNVLWGTFVRESDELLTQIKEMTRAVRDKKPVPETGDGSPQSILGKYNQLVTQSNDLWH